MGPRQLLGLPAPAKINLFLHVLGRRDDGYHEIQSAFVPIDLCDTLDFVLRDDGRIVREGDLTGPPEQDLAVRAARALQPRASGDGGARSVANLLGVTIGVEKRIPVVAGLGGGSSDAATTLIALNRLWGLRLSREALAERAWKIGADVPFFLSDGPAFVEGVGERCTGLHLLPTWYVVVYPQVHVSTAEIFSDPKLTRDTKGTTIAGFSTALSGSKRHLFGANDLEPVVRCRFPPVEEALRLLERHGPARMSGSGSAVYSLLGSAGEAQWLVESLRAQMPPGWSAWAVAALDELPLADWLRDAG